MFLSPGSRGRPDRDASGWRMQRRTAELWLRSNKVIAVTSSVLSVGLFNSTNPAFQVTYSASFATGISITGAAAGSRAFLAVISSGTNEGLDIDAKGSGTIRLGATSTGAISFSRNAVPTASDGAALGTSSLLWSDLFLASGAVINFNAGNVTITHSNTAATLTINDAGFLSMGAATGQRFYTYISGNTKMGLGIDLGAVRRHSIFGFDDGVNDSRVEIGFIVTSDGTTFTSRWSVERSAGNVVQTGKIGILTGTAIPAGGTAGAGYSFSSTSNFGVFFGSGAPTLAAAKGSLYLRSDGTTTNDRSYINTDGSTTWTALTTVA